MSAQQKLTLVAMEGARVGDAADPVRRVFDHWVFMLGKNPRRCALGMERRKVIRRALELYDEEVLLLAIEGCASSAWHAGENDRETVYQDIELILRNERQVERFCEMGEVLRARAARVPAVAPAEAVAPADAAAVEAQRARLRDLAARLRRGGA